jgi:acetyltransferase-like isoleucine patch superfamily enzyme
MPLRIEDAGSNNTVNIPASLRASLNGIVHLAGDDSTVTFHAGSISDELHIHVGTRASVEIGPNCRLGKMQIYTTQDNSVSIGANASFTYETRLHLLEPSSLRIGSGVLFADRVYITTSDMHSIIDVETGERINPSRDVNISDRVWLGMQVTVLKGASIGSGSIIGACSVVSGDIPPLSIASGQPARVTRQGVTWRPDLI